MSEDQALKLLLAGWRTPAAPDDLRLRVLASYRQQMNRPATEEGLEMKRCPMCHEEFAPQFRFCPLDGLPLTPGGPSALPPAFVEGHTMEQGAGERAHAPISMLDEVLAFDDAVADSLTPLHAVAAGPEQAGTHARADYRLTILAEASLFARLSAEVRAAAHESRRSWPELRRDPAGFARRTAAGYGLVLRSLLAQEHVAHGLMTALVVVLTLVGAVVALERYHTNGRAPVREAGEEYEISWANPIPNETQPEEGAAGMAARGAGGGSLQNRERPGGGGGGGRHETLPASQGKLPPAIMQPPLLAPDPKPPVIQNPSLPVPTTLQGDPVLFPPDARAMPYGDPKSQATELSSGPGDGNGIGDGHGAGVGTGDGNGYGPGTGWNTGGGRPKLGSGGPGCCGGTDYANRVFPAREVTKRAVITSKPTPEFTEEARRNNVTGEVVLRMVLTSNGTVTGIVPLKRLPDGLTEKAIAAARMIQFTPAEKDGRKVSQYVTVAYNFNIY